MEKVPPVISSMPSLPSLGFLTEFSDLLFDLGKAHLVGVAQNGHHQTAGRTHGNTDVEVAVVDDVVAIHRRVQDREFFQGVHGGFDEEAHETQLAAVFLLETVLHALAHVHDRGHVDFVEGGQNGVGRLRLQQTLGHPGPQTRHGHTLLRAVSQVHRRGSHLDQCFGGHTRGDDGGPVDWTPPATADSTSPLVTRPSLPVNRPPSRQPGCCRP
jgi:hypothetical protein